MKAIYVLASLCFVITACGPSSGELTATAVVAHAQTQTAAPTKTPTQTPTPQPTVTPTATPTATPTPPSNIINRMERENPVVGNPIVSDQLFILPKAGFNKALEDLQKMGTFSTCPEIWIGPVLGRPDPTYALIVSAAPENEGATLTYAIRPTIPEMEPYSIVGLVIVPQSTDEDFMVAVEYFTPEGEPNPEELEISLVFPGCEIYREIVSWP